jgi:hypothetical protein
LKLIKARIRFVLLDEVGAVTARPSAITMASVVPQIAEQG